MTKNAFIILLCFLSASLVWAQNKEENQSEQFATESLHIQSAPKDNNICEPASIPYIVEFKTDLDLKLPKCTSQQILDKSIGWQLTTDIPEEIGKNDSMLVHLAVDGSASKTWFFTQGVHLIAGETYTLSYLYSPATFLEESLLVAYGTTAEEASMLHIIADHPKIQKTRREAKDFQVAKDGVYYFGFLAKSSANSRALFLGEIELDVFVTCQPPEDIQHANIKSTSADITWLGFEQAKSWNLEYAEAGVEFGAGIRLTAISEGVYRLTGLTPDTHYTYYYQVRCEGDELLSHWSRAKSFKTNTIPSSIPFTEGFEEIYREDQILDKSWVQEIIQGWRHWRVNTTEFNFNREPRSGEANIGLAGEAEVWLFHPVQLVKGNTYELSFYARRRDTGFAAVQVGFGSSSELASMAYLTPEFTVLGGDYQEFLASFTPTSSGEYYLGIKGRTINYSDFLSLDDVSVSSSQLCIPVSFIDLLEVTETTASISWEHTEVEVEEYKVEVFALGADPMEDFTLFSYELASDSSFVELTELTPDTEYEVYVLSVCKDQKVERSLPIRVLTNPTASVVKHKAAEVFVYPNPVSHILKVGSKQPIQHYRLFSVLGKQLLSSKHVGTDLQLDVSSFPSGVYVLSLQAEGVLYGLKFVKE